MTSPPTAEILQKAQQTQVAVLAFNVPYLPMIAPVVRAAVEQDAFALVEVARLEWTKFEAVSPEAVLEEFRRWADPAYVRLHLDHIPVIDEDQQRVDWRSIFVRALDLGYGSVMLDGSRLPLEENIAVTAEAVALAHRYGVACEAELGAVLGHESGPLPPYEELFATGRGFTDETEARRFVQETGCDWLSVAIGNVHGAISAAARDQQKVQARLSLVRLDVLHHAAGIPLVLHGGSGIRREDLLGAVERGIVKVNIGSEVRQAYVQALRETGRVADAQAAVQARAGWLLRDVFGVSGTREKLTGGKAA